MVANGIKINPFYLAAALGVVGVFLYLKKNGVQGAAFNLGGAVVDAVNGVVGGVVVGISNGVGIPATNVDQCTADRRAGNKWDASFSCDAATFIKWIGRGAPTNI